MHFIGMKQENETGGCLKVKYNEFSSVKEKKTIVRMNINKTLV